MQLTLSPGRVDPMNPVWASSRKPLAGEFRYRGLPLFVVGNHFNSKGGDDPTFGRFQEPRRTSELQRRGSATHPADTVRGQAGANDFVRDLLDIDRARARGRARRPQRLRLLGEAAGGRAGPEHEQRTGAGEPWRLLPRSERYSYIFQGNAQTLDHILVSPALLSAGRPDLDVVHMNAEFADQALRPRPADHALRRLED